MTFFQKHEPFLPLLWLVRLYKVARRERKEFSQTYLHRFKNKQTNK